MSVDDLTSTCPTCERPLVPVLLHPAPTSGQPVSAEVPIVMRCPGCADLEEPDGVRPNG